MSYQSMNEEEVASYNILSAFYDRNIGPLEIHGGVNIFEDETDGLGQKDPISATIDKNNYLVQNRGYTDGCSIGLVHMCAENSICTRYAKKVKAEPLQNLTILREGDLLTALYIPSYISVFKYSVLVPERPQAFHLLYCNEGTYQTTEDLLRDEKSERYRLKHAVGNIERELNQERTQHFSTKWIIREADEMELGGESYRRVRLAEPFFPLISATKTVIEVTMYEPCSIMIEYALLNTLPRRALAEGDVAQLWDYTDDASLPKPTRPRIADDDLDAWTKRQAIPYKTNGSFLGGARLWAVEHGMVSDITNTRDELSELDEKYNHLIAQLQ